MSQLYARVFLQTLESSLAEDWQVRHVFEDFLKFADKDGNVDMTREAFCRRTNIPREVVDRAIASLESPDPESRNPDHDGRRLARLDDHRNWGWVILNWKRYDALRNQEQVREQTRERVRRFRQKSPSPVPIPESQNQTHTQTQTQRVTDCNAGSVTAPLPDVCAELPVSPSPVPIPESQNQTHTQTQTQRVTDCNAGSVTAPLPDVCAELPVELPAGFPKTEQEAIAMAMNCGVRDDFVLKVWNKCMGRNGLDSQKVPISRWAFYVKSQWGYEQERKAEAIPVAQQKPTREMTDAEILKAAMS